MSDTRTEEVAATGAGLVRFLEYAIEKGHLKTNTGQSMKTAVREVLSATEGEADWESIDLDSLDVEDVQRRFETLRAMKFSSSSLSTYQSRFRKSLEMFEEFRESPSTWRPAVKQRNRKPKASTASPAENPATTPPPAEPNTPTAAPAEPRLTPHRSSIIPYPFPIRDGVLAKLELPADLTMREAERIAAFVASLAVDTHRAPGDEA